MNLGELKQMSRLLVPGAKTTVVSDEQLRILLNQGKDDVASYCSAMPKKAYFNVTENKAEYMITQEVASDFLSISDMPIRIYDGSKWEKVYPKTEKFLDEKYVNFINQGSGVPLYYYIEGDRLGFYPAINATVANGGLIYYNRRSVAMTQDVHYPFHVENDQTVEISSLSILCDSILDYVKWKLDQFLSKSEKDVINNRKEYYTIMEERKLRIKMRSDINKDGDSKRQVGRP